MRFRFKKCQDGILTTDYHSRAPVAAGCAQSCQDPRHSTPSVTHSADYYQIPEFRMLFHPLSRRRATSVSVEVDVEGGRAEDPVGPAKVCGVEEPQIVQEARLTNHC